MRGEYFVKLPHFNHADTNPYKTPLQQDSYLCLPVHPPIVLGEFLQISRHFMGLSTIFQPSHLMTWLAPPLLDVGLWPFCNYSSAIYLWMAVWHIKRQCCTRENNGFGTIESRLQCWLCFCVTWGKEFISLGLPLSVKFWTKWFLKVPSNSKYKKHEW